MIQSHLIPSHVIPRCVISLWLMIAVAPCHPRPKVRTRVVWGSLCAFLRLAVPVPCLPAMADVDGDCGLRAVGGWKYLNNVAKRLRAVGFEKDELTSVWIRPKVIGGTERLIDVRTLHPLAPDAKDADRRG